MNYTAEQQEHIVAKSFLSEMIGHGFHVRVHEGGDWAGGSTRDVKKALSQTNSTGIDMIHVFLREENLDKANNVAKEFFAECKEKSPEKTSFKIGVAEFVFGNEGYNLINNNTEFLEQFMTKTNKVIGELDAGTYKPESRQKNDELAP